MSNERPYDGLFKRIQELPELAQVRILSGIFGWLESNVARGNGTAKRALNKIKEEVEREEAK